MTNNIIETFDLTKKYKIKGQNKEVFALNKANLSVKEGEIFGLLGPNGAGKTTMISILTTLIQPTSGYAIIDGYNIIKKAKKVKASIALMFESDMLYYRITAYDNLKFFCKIYDVSNYKEKIWGITNEFGLEKWLNQYVENFSSGMKMKLALCKTLLLNRKILFLDEPTLGLDVKSKYFIVNILKSLNKTIFLTSHDMSVVEKLCNRVAFINKGNILKIGTKKELQRMTQKKVEIEIEILENKNQLRNDLIQQNFINEVNDSSANLTISLKDKKYYKNLYLILSKYPSVQKIQEREASLEDIFLDIV